jgi:RNA polymerase sigma factor (sigma-70 family)
MKNEALFNDNQKLVGMVLKKLGIFRNNDMYEDYLQVGYIGLMKAAERFDPEFGTKFSTYAVPMIIGEIKRDRRNNGNVLHISRRLTETYNKYKYFHDMGYTDEEICMELGITIEALAKAIKAHMPLSYLDAPNPIFEDGNIALADSIDSGYDLQEQCASNLDFEKFLPRLKEDERKCIELRLQDISQMEIGEKLNISQAQVSRILFKVSEKMRIFNKEREANGLSGQVEAIKQWLINNPGTPAKVSKVLKDAGLQVINGSLTGWKRKAYKELLAEGVKVVMKGSDIYVEADSGDIKPESKPEETKTVNVSETKGPREDPGRKIDRVIESVEEEKVFFSFLEEVPPEAMAKVGEIVSSFSNHPTASRLQVRIQIRKVS